MGRGIHASIIPQLANLLEEGRAVAGSFSFRRDFHLHHILVEPIIDEPAFDSFQAAIGAGQSSNRAQRAASDQRRLAGDIVKQVFVSDTALALSFERGCYLLCSAGESAVEWEICDRLDPSAMQNALECNPVDLDFYGEAGHVTRRWNRAEIAAALIGNPLSFLFASVTWVFLACRGTEELMLSRCKNVDTGLQFLYFDWS